PRPVDEPLRLRERRIVEYLAERGPTRLGLLRGRLGMADAARVARQLANRGVIAREPVLVGARPPRQRMRAAITDAGRAALDADGLARPPRPAEGLAFPR